MGRVTRKRINELLIGKDLQATRVARIPSSGGTLPLPSDSVKGEEADVCPICGEPLKEMEYTGKKRLDLLPAGGFMVDPKEDGKVVWRVKAHVKAFPCFFSEHVLCSHRKSARAYVMDRCSSCSHHRRFEQQMDEEEKKTMDEFDEARRKGVHR